MRHETQPLLVPATWCLIAGVTVAALVPAGCSGDPVRQAAIDALGPESGPENADHRPGTPCLLCHSEGGPASSHFVFAGTIYKTNEPGSEGAEGVFVNFVDSNGQQPQVIPQTSASGNFFVLESEYPELVFPVRTGLYDDENGDVKLRMTSLINREGSCNACHQPNIENPTDAQKRALRGSAGQIAYAGGGS